MKVSVIVPVFNAGPFLADGVRSALALPEVEEVILVEDGSTDDSLARCRELAAGEVRVKLHTHPGGANLGAGASRNAGIQLARSAYIAFLDADDSFLPQRFHAEKRIFAAHPDADGVYGAVGFHAHDAIGAERFSKQFHSKLTTIRTPVPPEQLFNGFVGFSGILGFGHIHLDGLTVKKESLGKMDGLFRADLRLHQDVEWILRLAYYTRLYAGSIQEPIAMRGVHANNRITNNPERNLTRLRLYEARSAWAEREHLDRRIVHAFGRDTAHQRLITARGAKAKRKALATLLRHPGVLKRLDSSEALITLLFGEQSRTSRTLQRAVGKVHAWLWRIKGGRPPQPLGPDGTSGSGRPEGSL